jgi:hypothetical protein
VKRLVFRLGFLMSGGLAQVPELGPLIDLYHGSLFSGFIAAGIARFLGHGRPLLIVMRLID